VRREQRFAAARVDGQVGLREASLKKWMAILNDYVASILRCEDTSVGERHRKGM
jgi:hypothetical protein